MNRATAKTRDLAKLLVAYEARDAGTAGPSFGSFPVLEKLRPCLTALMGNGGYRALLLRCLALATAEVPLLQSAHVAADCRLEGFAALETGPEEEAIIEGRLVVVTQLIGLLVAFIGEKLTHQLVREVWPKLDAGDLKLKTDDSI
jgi:hypothetical protein